MRHPEKLFRLLNPPSDEEEAIVWRVIEAIEFPLERIIPAVMRDDDQAVVINWEDLPTTMGGVFRSGLRISMDNEARSRWMRPFTLAHEIGHMIDFCLFGARYSMSRQPILDEMHRPENLTWHMGESSHADVAHSDHPRSWGSHTVSWYLRPIEGFADCFVHHYVPSIWEEWGHNRRTMHWITDKDRFDKLMEVDMSIPHTRLGGRTRYETAAKVSWSRFRDPSQVRRVYVATGDDWPDTISAAAMASDGPLLLVPANGPVPDAVKSEIRRLEPLEIIVVGGEAAVSPEIVEELTTIRP